MHTLAIFLWLLWRVPEDSVTPQQDPQQLLRVVTTLRCDFPTGIFLDLARVPPLRKEAAGPRGIVFDGIDRDNKRVRLIGTVGTDDPVLIVGQNTLSFVETTLTGTPMVTVVYGRFRAGTRELIAVHSRHLGSFTSTDPEGVNVGQYYGSCTPPS